MNGPNLIWRQICLVNQTNRPQKRKFHAKYAFDAGIPSWKDLKMDESSLIWFHLKYVLQQNQTYHLQKRILSSKSANTWLRISNNTWFECLSNLALSCIRYIFSANQTYHPSNWKAIHRRENFTQDVQKMDDLNVRPRPD